MKLLNRIKKLERKFTTRKYQEPIVIVWRNSEWSRNLETKERIELLVDTNRPKIINWLESEGLISAFHATLIEIDSELVPYCYEPEGGSNVLVVSINVKENKLVLMCRDKILVLSRSI